MRKIELIKIELEEHEIGALEMISKIECPETSSLVPCPKCPLHINGNIILSPTGRTKCLALLCRDIVRRNREE